VPSLLPIVLNAALVRIGVAGAGDGLKRRLQVVERAGVQTVSVFEGQTPSDEQLAGLSVLFVAGLEPGPSRALAAAARARGVLVNVEDQPELCDFHVPASVRRGDLLLTVSTGGRSPGLARLVREELEQRFGPEWESRVDEVARTRSAWRNSGADPGIVSERTKTLVRNKGWLP
jgi:precorrin-2 dehydrogenase / sirohydrochlorin ferrochelatase